MRGFNLHYQLKATALLITLATTYSGASTAQQCTPSSNPPGKVPTKMIKIYNNTDKPIYPLIETNTNSVDEWLQAYFGLCDSSLFQHTLNYRIYVNGLQGIAPNSFAAVNVPVYTKVTDEPDPAYGKDKYINWWNGGRIKIYNSLITYKQDFENDAKSKVAPNSIGVTCTKIEGSECNDLSIYSGLGALKDDTPSQLTEYTFAGAPLKEGGNGLRVWAIQDVDWDVSYVDSAYLPIAMGIMGNRYIGYTGTTTDASTFESEIANFLAANSDGYNWSHYIIPGDSGNTIIKLPGTYNYMRGVLNKTVTPAPKNSPLNSIKLLWNSCFQQGSPSPKYYNFASIKGVPLLSCSDPLKSDMWKVQGFFLQNFNQYKQNTNCDYDKFINTLKEQKVPINVEMLARIYGWVPFNDYCTNAAAANSLCKTSNDPTDPAIKDPDPTICTKEYKEVHKIYRDLEYSYTGAKYPTNKEYTFNPYVELIHGKDFLNMNGYAFSIDDAVGNMQESGTGLIITVGGAHGLVNNSPYDPKSAITVTMGKPQEGRPKWLTYDACVANTKQCIPNSKIPNGATSFKLGTIKKFPIKVVIKDSANKIYQFIIKEGPNKNNQFNLPDNAVKANSCKVTDANGNPVTGWCAPFVNKENHGTPYANTKIDDNGRPVNYVSTNDTLQ